ncbi:MAG: bifunctional [glutamate--ammonia ligase]-adenylyl-L-tyrosine phosphorylase/[glutamate--ammonia-ligase] adenylyltransferase [Candidatus Hydrogenedentes bacterium]|nr:bifunctional [glutamate--ammonia ligase]-adenylyl-L-tyrosine phosphorylase/[glutamate--ammonia-ligase] adenylyltransferase [Candidatus Hydrogenedentota bacterium]
MHPAFEHIVFADAPQAARFLDGLMRGGDDSLFAHLAAALVETAHPSQSLVRLERYLEAVPDRAAVLERFSSSLASTRLAVTLFSQSHFLTDIVCREPELLPWLCDSAERSRPRSRDDMLADLLAFEGVPEDYETTLHALRTFRRREIARIAIRDIFEHASVPSLTLDLSNLADATLEVALRASQHHASRRFGQPRCVDAAGSAREASLVVLGMGKLGGRELNFSSDIDLLFLYTDEGQTTGDGGRVTANADYFRKVGELLIRAVSEQTAGGQPFRVDMRLRPFGATGPLAISLEAAIDYYTTYGRAWERQALIKTRSCAGDIALGDAFIERMRPFVFPRFFDDETLDDIRETKRQAELQIERRGETDREVKLGRGGIRDIEFTVQMLQLLNGGAWPELRTTNTLEAIEVLGRRHYLSPFEANALASHYAFLRRVEHRLQIEGSRQRHALPAEPEALDEFARQLGFVDGASFMNVYRDYTQETRAILDRFLAAKGSGDLWIGDLLNPRSDGHVGAPRLTKLGFREPERARKALLELCVGPPDNPHTQHVRQDFADVAPGLIRALGRAADPDRTLMRLATLLPRVATPGALYQILKSKRELSEYLVQLVSNSEYLMTILVRDPGLFDLLGTGEALDTPATRRELREELRFLASGYDKSAAIYRFRDGAMLRVGLRELVRDIALAQVGDELTLIAETVLEHALADARRKAAERYGATDTPFAVLGLGKLGGWEMGYGSDLDLIFVYDSDGGGPGGMSAQEYFSAVAAYTINRLTDHTRYGVLYDIDARLRPDGNKGMLAVGHRRLDEYYLDEAQSWERLALMKARAVAGDLRFGLHVERQVKDLSFSLPLSSDTLARIETLRSKLAEQSTPLDLKRSPGGINEIEFITRLWQLRYVHELPELKRGDVFGALDILMENGLVDPPKCAALYDAYGQLRRILNRIRMMHGGHETDLPADPESRRELAARLGIVTPDLAAYVDEHKKRVHAIYNETLEHGPATA